MVLIVTFLCFSAFIILSFSFGSSEETKIQSSISKGTSFLKRIQRADGAICDTVNPLFETWETIAAAEALFDTDRDTNEICFKKAMSYLRSVENEKGLVCHNRKCGSAYCLETTSAYFLLLLKISETQKVKDRLPSLLELQKTTGEWEIGSPDVREQKSFPSVTAFVVRLLSEMNTAPFYKKEADLFLRDAQYKNGHFGTAWEYYNCYAYALWPVMTIKDPNFILQSVQSKAFQFIENSQQKDGRWFYTDSLRGPSAELQTALMLSALPENKSSEKIREKGFSFLVNHQSSAGYWDGGFFPVKNKRYVKKEYVFATARAVSVLNQFIRSKEK
jgi:hypothetical protein